MSTLHQQWLGRIEREPAAWMHPNGRVVSAATMTTARRDGGAMASSLSGYVTPLVAADDVRDAWNNALEAAALLVETNDLNSAAFNAVEIRAMKRPASAPAHTSATASVPKINAEFETVSNGWVGSTEAKIKRVEVQDDGVLTIVIDHWPAAPVAQADHVRDAIERAAQICEATCVCDDGMEDYEINWVLRNRAAKIRALFTTSATPADAEKGGA